MADLLKNIYNEAFFDQYCRALGVALSSFDARKFIDKVKDHAWEDYELKQRMSQLAIVTDEYLTSDYVGKVKTIKLIITELRRLGVGDQNLAYIFLADIITIHGIDDLETSFDAIAFITQFTSFEFAGRAFFIKHPKQMMQQMLKWSKHKSPFVRRFASEGCRPRLPWGLQLKDFCVDPMPIIPILENLKDDPSEYVRKSVANNLNDISKDHADVVIELIRKWQGTSKNTDWILKHGSRTLLKQGHTEILDIFGTSSKTLFEVSQFNISQQGLRLGDTLSFEFKIINKEKVDAKFRLEYIIYFVKSNGQPSKKIFKISEPTVFAGQTLSGQKNHRFVDLTTRKHYAGLHKIALVVNGKECQVKTFHLDLK
jgi:3-methyladenine DNA glycosylase AlkC